MTWSQTFVVTWIQFVLSAGLLLFLARLVIRRLPQPVDRLRLIQCSLAAAAVLPLAIALAPWSAYRLDLVEAPVDVVTIRTAANSETIVSSSSSSDGSNRGPLTGFEGTHDIHGPPHGTDVLTAPQAASASVAGVSQPGVAGDERRFDWWGAVAGALIAVYGMAALYFSIEWIAGALAIRRLVRNAMPATSLVNCAWEQVTESHGAGVQLLVSASIDAPLMFGRRRPVVMIPARLAEEGGDALRFCLTHEWSHIDRGDLAAWGWVRLCQYVLWALPPYWKLRRELRLCQDILADERATRAGEKVEYSELLFAFARERLAPRAAGALSFADETSQLTRRIRLLLERTIAVRPRCTWTFSLMAGTAAVLFTLLVSGVRVDSTRAMAIADEAPVASRSTEPKESSADSKPGEATGVATQQATPPAADLPAARKYTCSVVEKETGKAISNARVTVRRSSLTATEDRLIAETKHVTDAEGKYEVEFPPEQVADRYTYVVLDVEHDDYPARKGWGYSLGMIMKNETLGERPFFERTELYPGEPVTGRVVSPDGQPLSDVKVLGFSMASPSNFESTSFTDTFSGPDGRFRLMLQKDANAVLWVIPKDFGITEKFIARKRDDLGEFRVPAGIRARGRVLDAAGKPVAGVAVNIDFAGTTDTGGLPVASSIRRGAISDAEGNFVFDPLAPGDYRVKPDEQLQDPLQRGRAMRGTPLSGVFMAKRIALKEGIEPALLEIQAVPHVIFNAQVVDSQGNKTRGHAFHLFGKMDGEYWFGEGRPNAEGTIAMLVPHGLQEVQVQLSTNEHGALRYRRSKDQPLEQKTDAIQFGTLNDDVVGFEIVRYRAPLVIVSAVDEAGQPVKDFRVAGAYAWGNQRYVLEGEQRSDLSFEKQTDGRRRTSQMLPDEEVTFTVSAPGYEPASEKVKLPEGESKELVVTLKKSSEAK